MKLSKKGILIAIIAVMSLLTVTSAMATKPEMYVVRHALVAGYYQKLVDGAVEEWAWGECNLMLMPEKGIVSFHATLETIDGETINYSLKEYLGIRYYAFRDVWFINGVYEVKYGDEVYTKETEMSYSVRRNRVGSVYFPQLGAEVWEKGTTIIPPYEP